MAPEIVRRKLAYLQRILADLEEYRSASLEEVQTDHYAIERMLELLVMAATDLLAHLLVELGRQPDSYRAAFLQAGECGLVPTELAERLAGAASMRNLIVHMYEMIDYPILAKAIDPALDDFAQLVAVLAPLADADESEPSLE